VKMVTTARNRCQATPMAAPPWVPSHR